MSAGNWAYSSTPVLTSQQQADIRAAKEKARQAEMAMERR